MPTVADKDEGDREWQIKLAAAQKWLSGKSPEVWLWMKRQQEASHDEYGILEWMETQPEFQTAIAVNLPPGAANELPEDLRPHRNPETWDFFKEMMWVDCPRPGSTEFSAWLQNPSTRAKALYPDLFPEAPTQKLPRYVAVILFLAVAIAGTYGCVRIRLG